MFHAAGKLSRVALPGGGKIFMLLKMSIFSLNELPNIQKSGYAMKSPTTIRIK
jgi:hypothetical protein